MPSDVHIPELPHPLHEWIEIEVGTEDSVAGYWVYGLHSPGGQKMLRYPSTLIKVYQSRDEAISVGQEIARRASAERLLLGLPFRCAFTLLAD